MKKLISYETSVVDKWNSTFRGIERYLWPKVKAKFVNNHDLDFIKNKELRIAIFSLYPNSYNKTIQSREFKDTLGNNSIFELLNQNVNLEESENVVKYHLSTYFSFLYK